MFITFGAKRWEASSTPKCHYFKKYFKEVIGIYKAKVHAASKRLDDVVFVLIDGCASQLKSRKQALLISNISQECGLKSFSHTYVPTSCLKCFCDGEGADTEAQAKLLCKIRAHTPFCLF